MPVASQSAPLRLLLSVAIVAAATSLDAQEKPPSPTVAATGKVALQPPTELIGPIPPSIHVPPVRTGPPARTRPIARPPQYDPETTARKRELPYRMESLRLAIDDLIATYGESYPHGPEYVRRWEALSAAVAAGEPDVEARFARLRRDAMLANPLLDFDRLLVLKRRRGQLGLPTNHQCNTSLKQDGYDNEIALLSPVGPQGKLTALYRPPDGAYVGEIDLHFSADRLLFTMPNGRTWQIHEIGIDGGAPRQVSREIADVDNFDACYLPGGRIVYGSTASFTGVPCWHGRERACCLYAMDADGGRVAQLCFDQDLDLHPSVLPSGQVIFSRWDYTGLLHAYVRPLMVMNPDGTGQRAVYGSNSYYPNCLFYPRAVPGHPNKVAAILTGYHGRNRMGELVVLDISAGWSGTRGIVHRITHRGEPIVPLALDRLTEKAWPQFLHPLPLSDKYLLASMQSGNRKTWGIYLVDIFDNITPLLTDEEFDFYEPVPVKAQPAPRDIPDRTNPKRDDAVVVLHDIYKGPGLAGVPRGTIKSLRVAAYEFGYPGMAGPDKIGRGGPWEAMRILGTVPVYDDGSARFRVPANTPLALQALDSEGKAVQLMRSWYTAMPGELASCVGCHETPRDTPVVRGDVAASRPISEITPWYGPPRGFDFAREVQPVLDRHCVECHDGRPRDDGQQVPDLRDERLVANYQGLPLTQLGATRIDASLPERYPQRFPACQGMPQPYGNRRTLYTPAYEALIPYIRRVNIEDGVSLLRPGEYHADSSELIQMLQTGHHGVQLQREDWDRLVTWIDLNGPCHGTWADVAEIPAGADRRRREVAQAAGIAPVSSEASRDVAAAAAPPSAQPNKNDDDRRAERRRAAQRLLDQIPQSTGASYTTQTKTLALGSGITMELIRVPGGRFVLGDTTGRGEEDEWPAAIVTVDRAFWIGRTEVTNAQFRSLLPDHVSGYFTKRQIERDGPGIQLDEPNQPAVRVTWTEAAEFCRLLAQRTGQRVLLPTEAQWEYAARATTATDLWYGAPQADFSESANLADRSLACLYEGTAGVAVLQPFPAAMEFDDLAIATANVASFRPNRWGLYDMAGNAAEWTRSAYRSYPYRDDDGRNAVEDGDAQAKRVVRGGSFCDRPTRARSADRRAFAPWAAMPDVGFRIAIEEQP